MAVNVAARKLQFRDKDGADYPGFLSLSCGWEAVGAGLVIWTGTAEIAEHPGNGRPIDTRTNRETWFYAQPVSLSVQADSGVFAEPKCLPKMFVTNAKFDPTTRRLSLELTCVLGLLKDYTADDFRDKFEEENAVEESPEEKFRVDRCGNPEEEDYDPSKGEANAEKRAREWWRRWEGEGECAISEIVFEVLSRLGCGCSGKVEGKIRLPHSLSGSLLGACGELCRKALKPSYLVSDGRGRALIRQIDLDPPPGKALTLFDVKSFSLNNSAPPISELVVTGQIPELAEDELDETEDEIETLEDGSKQRITRRTITVPANTLADTVSTSGVLAKQSVTVERVAQNKKTIIEGTVARYKVLFPESQDRAYRPTDWCLETAKEEKQYFDGCTGELIRKEITEWLSWGRVFGAFYQAMEDGVVETDAGENKKVEGDIGVTILAGELLTSWIGNVGIPWNNAPIRADIPTASDRAKYSPEPVDYRHTEIKYTYHHKTGKLIKKERTTTEPASYAAPSYPAPLNGRVISEVEIETWKEWGSGHQEHSKILNQSWEKGHSQLIKKAEDEAWEEYARQTTADYFNEHGSGSIAVHRPTVLQSGFTRTWSYDPDEDGTYEPQSSTLLLTCKLNRAFVSAEERLTLVGSEETQTENSRSGTANSPGKEHLPRGNRNSPTDPGDGATEKWEAKTKVWRQKWNLPARGDYLPRREVLNLGDVYSLDYLEVQALLAFQLRQVQSQTYQCAVPLSDDFLTSPFAPARRWDITEPDGAAYAYLATALNFEFSEATCFALAELWLLGPGTGAAYEPPAVTAFTLDYVPPAESGTFLLDGAAVTGGQTLTPEQFASLTFVPGVSYSGAATLSYAATGGDGQTGTTQAIAAVDPSYDPVTVAGQETPPLENGGSVYAGTDGDGNAVYLAPTASVAVSPGSAGIAVAPPTDYESAGLAYTAPQQVESQFQATEVLRRLRIERDRRLSLTRQERLTKLYR